MFDDQNNNQGQPPANLPTEPVDMFAGVDKNAEAPVEAPNAIEAGVLKKKEDPMPRTEPAITRPPNTSQPNQAMDPNVMPQMGGNAMYAVKEPILGKIIMAMLLAVILGGLGFGGWWVYTNYMNPTEPEVVNIITTTDTTTVEPENIIAPIETATETVVTTSPLNTNTTNNSDATIKMNNDKILFGEPVDSDKDGLDDVREKELSTDANNADTDADGLLDGDEVIVIKTNPLNPDTDGDGYKDGDEVRNGYNPLGAGKLFNPAPTSTINDSGKTTTTKK
ncbi:MAG: hypothetical protein Q7S24_01805 [bacterium]|nr:hypothetical protein [bacterium]